VNKPVKFPEIKKEAFTKAREGLGLSTRDLSGMACLSVRQIEQIENGELSSFYGPQVKFTAAKKVAGLLKLSEEDAFDFSETKSSKNQEPSPPTEELKPPSATVATPANQAATVKPVEKTKIHAIGNKNLKSEALPSASSKGASSQKKWFLLLGITAALIFSVINLRPLFFPEPVKEEIVIVQEVAPANPPPEAAQEAKPATSAPEAPVATAPVVATSPAVSTECPPADAAAVSYKPDAPKKAGDMVYLQSKTAQTVCVLDAAGKTQNKTLEAGVGVSVYGKPPLKVLTSGQTPVDIYYQGTKVRISNTAAKTIILEPAEIIQPANAMDSQLR
jgi:transcriptional regulator with XRE-family HTH domain